MKRPWLPHPFLRSLQPAQSLFEVILALALAAILFTVAFLALPGQLTEISASKDSIRALALAKEGIEASRLTRDRDWNALTAGTHGLVFMNGQWAFQGSADTQENLTRTITVSDTAANKRSVISEVTWTKNLRTHRIRLASVISNWRNSAPPLLHGNWQNPQTLSSIDLGPGNEATALAVRTGIVYLTAQASNSNKPDFFIVDASTPTAPVMRGNVNTSGGLNAVALSGSYAFVANQDETESLQVINVSNPNSPLLATSLNLGSSDSSARSIAIHGAYAYIGKENSSDGPEFFIVDITNPLQPVVRGSLEIGGDVRRIAVHNNRVILGTGKDDAELIIVNATSPSSPVQTTSYNPPGANDALGLYVNPQDNRAYLTRSGGSSSNPDIYLFDLTNPDTPILLGTDVLGSSVNAVFAADNLAFFGTSASSEEFKIFEASNPVLMTYYSGLNFPQVSIDLRFEDNIVYVAARSNDALRIVTSQ